MRNDPNGSWKTNGIDKYWSKSKRRKGGRGAQSEAMHWSGIILKKFNAMMILNMFCPNPRRRIGNLVKRGTSFGKDKR